MQTTATTPLQPQPAVTSPPSSSTKRTVNNNTEETTHYKKRKEQTLDYVVRSGVAGGIAGCLVSLYRVY